MDDAPLQTGANAAGHDVDQKPALPFLFKTHNKLSIPSYTKLVTTQSQHLSENNTAGRSSRRPSPFFMSKQQQVASQRNCTADSQTFKPNFLSKLIKHEERPPIICQNVNTPLSQANRSFFSGARPQSLAIDHQATSSLSADQFVRPLSVASAMPDDYASPKPPTRGDLQTEISTQPQPPNEPMFRILTRSHVPQSTPSRDFASPECNFKNPTSSSRYRSRSVVPYDSGGEDDISVMMMRGATEVRNVRAELEEQRREVSYLHSELQNMSKEKEELSRRLDATKAVAKKGLEMCGNNYTDLNSAFEGLKAQSQASFELVEEARTTLSDLTEAQKSVAARCEGIQTMFDDYGKGSETKALIRELQEEYLNSQRVTHLLREKLQTAGGDLAEAKNRIAELESVQLSEIQTLKVSSSNMLQLSEKISKMVNAMKQKELESIEALKRAADAEVELTSAKEKISELVDVVTSQGSKIESARHLEQQNATLKNDLDDNVSRLATAESAQKEASARLEKFINIMQEQRTQLRVLEASVTAHEQREAELRASFQSQTKEHCIAVQELQDNLRLTGNHEQVALAKNVQFVERTQVLENELTALRKDLRTTEEKSQEATERFLVLQERFDDQSVTLRITKELSGDLQERLLVTEAAFAGKFEAHSGTMNLEIAVLKEQKANLQTTLERTEDQAKESSKAAREKLITITADFEKQLAQQEAHHICLYQLEEQRRNQVEKDLVSAKNAVIILEERLRTVDGELEELKERLDERKGLSSSQLQEVASLKARVRELEGINIGLIQREKVIDARYKEGDLSDEEKAFVNSLIQLSQSIHQQELVSKGNELRRRDNMIASLNTKISLLESTLARHLQAKARADVGNNNHSMINLKSFMSSSPHAQIPKVAPVTSSTSVLLPLSPASPQYTETNPAAAPKPPTHNQPSALMPLVRLTFTRLATAASDDIDDSDDDIPLSESLVSVSALGKRDRLSSQVKGDDTARPSRRLRAVAKKPELEVAEHKRSESVVKSKARKHQGR